MSEDSTQHEGQSLDRSTTSIEMEDADPLRLAFFEQSDLGNAERPRAGFDFNSAPPRGPLTSHDFNDQVRRVA